MVLLEKLWDDVIAGPQPELGLGRLRKITTQPLAIKDEGEGSKYQRSLSMNATPGTPVTPVTPTTPTTPVSARRENVWRSVFHPGSNLATKSIGAEVFDKPQPNSPTVYDCNQTETQRQSRKENLAICLVAAWK
ncbi:dormancy-associated protein 1-like isoform X1 [Durio zibethinus]|uniref:Dormancy-associated protein 1-like isoform X1 n=1 Tax=Durio zibethinus TaxID=66656 RepID=A0A6P5WIS3_DURZI|nr:dormancy-associated protein 1-like isoform X1 [Durio zibethinus]XP_022715843.1 dormancy-associated protein 1-like isoform X1 [Durio zibethinus]